MFVTCLTLFVDVWNGAIRTTIYEGPVREAEVQQTLDITFIEHYPLSRHCVCIIPINYLFDFIGLNVFSFSRG